MQGYSQILLFLAILLAGFFLLNINPFRRRNRIALGRNVLRERRQSITKRRLSRWDKFLVILETLLRRSGQTQGRFILFLTAAFCGGSILGWALFNGILLSLVMGAACLPLPYLFINVLAQKKARVEVENLENTMSLITNNYIGCDDLVRAVDLYVQDKIHTSVTHKTTPFEEFVTEIIFINPDVERGLQILSAKIANPFFDQWIKMLILCHQDRRLKFALPPVIDAMNDAKSMQIESDALMSQTWRNYFLTVGLMFGVIPLLRIANDQWYNILTQTAVGRVLIIAMLVIALVTGTYVMKINKPLTSV